MTIGEWKTDNAIHRSHIKLHVSNVLVMYVFVCMHESVCVCVCVVRIYALYSSFMCVCVCVFVCFMYALYCRSVCVCVCVYMCI